jgi:hypothetical protein
MLYLLYLVHVQDEVFSPIFYVQTTIDYYTVNAI